MAMLPILMQHVPRDRERMGLREVEMAGRLARSALGAALPRHGRTGAAEQMPPESHAVRPAWPVPCTLHDVPFPVPATAVALVRLPGVPAHHRYTVGGAVGCESLLPMPADTASRCP